LPSYTQVREGELGAYQCTTRPEDRGLVNRLARRRGQTKSEVIREALVAFARAEERTKPRGTFYDSIAHVIGCVNGGPPDLSERTGEKFRALLLARTRR
jgi:hypothetical protein